MDVPQDAESGCGCATGAPEGLDVASLARVVKELDARVKELESQPSEASRSRTSLQSAS
ncbi:hypothetical protein BH20ACT20_BH20ACT20_05570 [soil metagenome]